ncbi:sensor histidine kinase [Allochromatium palmeri]|uniref:histidine kinase n=1 Tax=Allochromatium palmeri TaxID=231048 RepID=A0A6N8E8C5_9GAMM|nr:sensor histidine kinase [Allochromatium palmeri]MTW20522.1 GHKL domain-containing protein [Allochromatium palmeri]
MTSLEGRLHLGLALSLALLIGGAWWLGHMALHHTANAFVLSRLEHDAEAVVGALRFDARGHLRLESPRLTSVYEQPYSGHYFVIASAAGEHLRSRSLWDTDLEIQTLYPGETRHWTLSGPAGQPLVAWAEGYRFGEYDLVVVFAEDITLLTAELRHFEHLFAVIAVLGLMLILLIQRLIVRRAFASLRPIDQDIEQLERGRIVTLSEDVPREMQPLVRKLNRLLVLLGQRLERSRTAAGNLSHAIKGPLVLLRQYLNDPKLDLTPETRAGLLDQVERLRQIAERQLKRARLAGAGGVGESFEPAAELPVLKRLLERIHAERALQIELDYMIDAPLALDREDMLELLGNLLDNACKWARERVRACLFIEAGTLVLRVEDDGPGCSEEAIVDITERGVRLDEQVGGHGLGLAIVKEIVASYQGILGFERAGELGGLGVDVRLPLQDRNLDGR